MNNSIYLRRCGKIQLEPGQHQLEPEYLAALQENLSSLGYTLAPELAERLMTLSVERLGKLYRQLIHDLQAMLGDHVSF
ncbi:MAG: hypothetical protein CVV27_17580, partial [Candidatus Melainabacteria bacterium HGW-Melainabacteria-1]